MDIDFIKNGGEDQMEFMLLHMEKLPNFSASYDYPIATNYSQTTPPVPLSAAELPPEFPSYVGDAAEQKRSSMAAMREMIFRMATMQPIQIDPEAVKPPKRRNVRISTDPQSVAARHRRERISERIRILQRLVPGGTKMDTASMLDEAIHYVKVFEGAGAIAGAGVGELFSGGGERVLTPNDVGGPASLVDFRFDDDVT